MSASCFDSMYSGASPKKQIGVRKGTIPPLHTRRMQTYLMLGEDTSAHTYTSAVLLFSDPCPCSQCRPDSCHCGMLRAQASQVQNKPNGPSFDSPHCSADSNRPGIVTCSASFLSEDVESSLPHSPHTTTETLMI